MEKQTKKFEIGNFQWMDNGYRPKTYVSITRDDGGFLLEFTSYEAPVSLRTAHNDNVYLDSCMEFFLKPCADDARYFNFETNSNGAMLCGFGDGRNGRKVIPVSDIENFDIQVVIFDDRWELTYYISKEFIQKEIPSYRHGEPVFGNFTKCGDETEFEHYGTWCDIPVPEPDFHVSEYFRQIF